jgi:Transposase DDE domain
MPSPAIPELYRSLHTYLVQTIPDECDSRLTNLILLMMGLFQSRSVQLNLVARKTPIRAKKLSIVKRFERFLNNAAVRVRPWYRPFAQALVVAAASAGQVHLIIDTSKVAFGFRLVMVSVAYQRRSLPLVWTWARGSRGHITTLTQIKLLAYVTRLLPRGVKVSLVGDCEFGNPLLIEYVQAWGWNYALRQPGDNLVMLKGTGIWQRLDSLPLGKGQPIWIGNVVLTQASAHPTHLVLYWQRGEKKPWLLATNLLDPRAVLRLYRRRMWIEEMFGDMKKHGFDLEASHLRHFLRLSRLTLAVCLLYLWLVAMAEHVITSHQAHEVDRHDRRDLSLFRLGWDFVERRLTLFDPIPPVTIPTFCLPPGRSLSNLCSVSGG